MLAKVNRIREMRPLTRLLIALAVCGIAFVFAFAFRVLLPHYQQQQDRPAQLESEEEVRAIMRAINRFVEEDPERKFPSSLAEVKPLIDMPGTNLDAVLARFVYIQPPLSAPKGAVFGSVILIEKLGHYKNREGGYCGKAGGTTPGWCPLSDYKRLAEKSGRPIQQFSQYGNPL